MPYPRPETPFFLQWMVELRNAQFDVPRAPTAGHIQNRCSDATWLSRSIFRIKATRGAQSQSAHMLLVDHQADDKSSIGQNAPL